MHNNRAIKNSKISVVMITRNRRTAVKQSLGHLTQLPENPHIIVVDNHSTDGTAELIADRFPEVELVRLNKNIGAVGRNIGVMRSTTPYIAFSDDDSWWQTGALDQAIKYFEQYPKVGVIAGKILVNDEKRLDPTSALQSISPLTPYVDMPGPAILGFLGCQLIVRKEAFMEAGGYSKLLHLSGEEELLGWDIAARGWGMTYCDDVVGRHYPSSDRDMAFRYRLGTRNIVRRAWLRRPLSKAIRKTFDFKIHSPGGIYDIIGFIQGVLSIPQMLPQRRVLPWWVEDQARILERQNQQLANRAKQKQREFAREIQLGAG